MKQLAKSERMAVHVSNITNLVLFVAKVYASVASRSLAVIASTLDSLLDLLSGFILWFTANAMKNPNQYYYPIGKKRMQPVVLQVLKFFFSCDTSKANPMHKFLTDIIDLEICRGSLCLHRLWQLSDCRSCLSLSEQSLQR